MPRIGRIVVARGRDAADIPLINSFGPHVLKSFRVWTYEVVERPTSPLNLDPNPTPNDFRSDRHASAIT